MNRTAIAARNAEIVAMYNNNVSAVDIMKHFNVSNYTVYNALRMNGVRTSIRRYPGKEEEIAKAIREGYTVLECTQKFHCSKGTVSLVAKENNLRDAFVAFVDEATENKMKAMRASGYSNEDIARKTGFSDSTVRLHIGRQPEEITKMNKQFAGKRKTLKTNYRKAAHNEMVKNAEEERIRLEKERLAAIEAERIEKCRKNIEEYIDSILGFHHEIATIEEGRCILNRIINVGKDVA